MARSDRAGLWWILATDETVLDVLWFGIETDYFLSARKAASVAFKPFRFSECGARRKIKVPWLWVLPHPFRSTSERSRLASTLFGENGKGKYFKRNARFVDVLFTSESRVYSAEKEFLREVVLTGMKQADPLLHKGICTSLYLLALARGASIAETVARATWLASEEYGRASAFASRTCRQQRSMLRRLRSERRAEIRQMLLLLEYLAWREADDRPSARDVAAQCIANSKSREIRDFVRLDATNIGLLRSGRRSVVNQADEHRPVVNVTLTSLPVGVKERHNTWQELERIERLLSQGCTDGEVTVAASCARKFLDERKMAFWHNYRDDQRLADKYVFRRLGTDPRKSQCTMLWCMRNWNSYVPMVGGPCSTTSGGYFVEGPERRGIVVDPGYGFAHQFFEGSFSLDEVAAVLVTHDHTDHTGGLLPLIELMSLHRLGLTGTQQEPTYFLLPKSVHDWILKVVRSNRFFSPLVDNGTWVFRPLVAKDIHSLSFWSRNHTEYHVMPFLAAHPTAAGDGNAFGFSIAVKAVGADPISIGFTGDGEMPRALQLWDGKPAHNRSVTVPVGHPWDALRHCSVVVGHVGTVEAQIVADAVDQSGFPDEYYAWFRRLAPRLTGARKATSLFYEGHLGLLGLIRLLQFMTYSRLTRESHGKPKMLLVSEFGAEFNDSVTSVVEELRMKRSELVQSRVDVKGIPLSSCDVIPLSATCGFVARLYDDGTVQYRCDTCRLREIVRDRIYHALDQHDYDPTNIMQSLQVQGNRTYVDTHHEKCEHLLYR